MKENEVLEDSLQQEEQEETVVEEKKQKKEKSKKYDVTKDEQYIKLLAENNDLKEKLLYKQADFENYRKRMQEEKMKDRKYALNDFLTEAIDILDVFDKAVNVTTDDEKLKKFLNGFVMVNKRLNMILENHGVTKINCLNKPFDPNTQSALETVEVEGVESGIVTEVVMTGYMYKDRVLRPAMVKVTK